MVPSDLSKRHTPILFYNTHQWKTFAQVIWHPFRCGEHWVKVTSHRNSATPRMPSRSWSQERTCAPVPFSQDTTGLSHSKPVLFIIFRVAIKEVCMQNSCLQVAFSPVGRGTCLQVPWLKWDESNPPPTYLWSRAQHSRGLCLPRLTGLWITSSLVFISLLVSITAPFPLQDLPFHLGLVKVVLLLSSAFQDTKASP